MKSSFKSKTKQSGPMSTGMDFTGMGKNIDK